MRGAGHTLEPTLPTYFPDASGIAYAHCSCRSLRRREFLGGKSGARATHFGPPGSAGPQPVTRSPDASMQRASI
jgi:hypothetical protein